MPRRPRNRAIHRKVKRIGLADKQLEHLIFGHTWLDDEFPFESENHRRQCWERHRDEIMAMVTDDEEVRGFKPYLLVGMRPEAWFEYEDVPERKITITKIQPGNIKHPGGLELENREVEPTDKYLDRTVQWLTDEKRRYLAIVERREVRENKLRRITDLDERREMLSEVRKAREEYED